MGLNPQALDLITKTILGEADANDPASYQAVAHVIKNRVDSGAWGDNSRLGPVIGASKQFSLWNKAGMPSYSPPAPGTNPAYDRAAAVAQGVFSGQIPDNTGGATHYYAPRAMATPGSAPDWAVGHTGKLIGSQYFYNDIPLNAATTAGTVDTHAPPPTVQTSPTASAATSSPSSDADAQSARTFLSSISQHSDRAGDTANLNPQFATALANSIKQARAQGLNVSVMSAFREPGQTGSAYDAGGNSSHTYGLASDIAGLDGPNGKITQQWAQIAAQNGLHNPYGVGNTAEFNHWQLPAAPLEQTPQLLAALKEAKATGDMSKVWGAYSGASPESQIATRQTYPPVASEGVNPNAPAVQAQPTAATAPGSSGGNFAVPPAGPGSNKYSVVQGMTTGTSHNPQLTTAANWGNLFGGGGSPSSPPAAAPAAASPPQPASAPAAAFDPKNPPLPPERPAAPTPAAPVAPSIANAPLPPQRPLTLPTLSAGDFNAPHVPNWGPWHAGGSPSGPIIASPSAPSSIVPNWGAANPVNPDTMPNTGGVPGGGVTGRAPMTAGAPSMGFPAMTQPPTQVSQLPGSMMASAQNLIKLLFPSNVG